MGRVILQRLAVMPLLALGASFVIFSALYVSPGSPESALLGGRHVDEATVQHIRDRYNLDDPFLVQYGKWLVAALHGDLGDSISQQDTVAAVLRPRILPTLELAALASVIIVVGGVLLGMISAVFRERPLDSVLSMGALVFSAVPSYVMALLLISVFAVSLGWFPVIGLGSGGSDRLYHLTLPALALAASTVALVSRTTRASMVRALSQEFIETAQSRGLPSRTIVGKHALRHALIPVVTISGLIAGYMLSGAVIVEYAFGLNGMGALLVQAVGQKDFALVQAISLLMVVAFLVINLVVDLLYAWIDPRVRLQPREA
jgi:peptide/nickel transport system permease protein